MRHTHQYRRTAVLETVHPRACRRQHLLNGRAEANGIKDKIGSASGDFQDALHRIFS